MHAMQKQLEVKNMQFIHVARCRRQGEVVIKLGFPTVA